MDEKETLEVLKKCAEFFSWAKHGHCEVITTGKGHVRLQDATEAIFKWNNGHFSADAPKCWFKESQNDYEI